MLFQFADTKREMLTADTVRTYVEQLSVKDWTQYTSINLSGKSFGLEAAQAIAEILVKLTNIVHADLSDIIAGRPEVQALQVLTIMTQPFTDKETLTTLDMSNNALGLKGIKAIEDVLKARKHSLTKLYFTNNGLEADAVRYIGQCLLDDESSQTKLRVLHVTRNVLKNEGAQQLTRIISQSPQLQELRVFGTRIGSQGCFALTKSLSSHREITLLDFSDNSFSTKEVSNQLAKVLSVQPLLKHLNLSATSLESSGVIRVAKALLKSGAQLETLDLSMNDFNARAAKFVADVLFKQTGLKKLSLEENEVRTKGIKEILAACALMTELETLNLNSCQLTSDSVDLIASFLKSKTSEKFQKVELNLNFFSDDSLEELQGAAAELDASELLGSFDDNDAEGEADLEDADDEEEEEEEDEEEEEKTSSSSSAASAAVDSLSEQVAAVKL